MNSRLKTYFYLYTILCLVFLLLSCQAKVNISTEQDTSNTDEVFEELAKEQIIVEVEDFLNKIYQEEVKKIYFTAYNNVNQSYTFLHFIDNEELTIQSALVNSQYTSTRPGIIKSKIDWIVIHDTGNNAIGANGLAHSNYLTKNNPGLSWHYTVDENLIYQHIPDNEVAWHAGDGLRETGTKWYSTTYNKTNYGGGNMNGIGIETCVQNGTNYLKTFITTAKLAATLLDKYDLEIDALKMHYDFSGKNCPYILRKDNYFSLFKEVVSYYLEALKLLDKIEITYISSSPYLDEEGLIAKDITTGTAVEYSVIINYQGQEYQYDYLTKVL